MAINLTKTESLLKEYAEEMLCIKNSCDAQRDNLLLILQQEYSVKFLQLHKKAIAIALKGRQCGETKEEDTDQQKGID